MNQKKKLSTKLIILIPVFILGIFSIISNVMSVSNIRNVNRSAVQISEVSLKNVSGLAEIQRQTQDIHNLGLSHIIAVDLDSMIQLVEKIRCSVEDDLFRVSLNYGRKPSKIDSQPSFRAVSWPSLLRSVQLTP